MMPESKYQELIGKIKGYMPQADEVRIHEAYDLATDAHEGQKRRDGSDYVTHPIAVAEIVADMELDTDSVVAALLHDCIEDTEFGYDKIKAKFGKEVADIVDGVSKLTRMPYTSKEEAQIENLRKMFLAMGKDIRVILIKIADRLHNMRTIEFHKPEKQREKALETMEVYAPLAHRLGMQKIKWELEDRSLRCLDPVGYAEITEELEKRSEERDEFLNQIKERLVSRLNESGIDGKVQSRVKHIYSIYRKMYTQHKTIDEVYDLYAMRVIVETVADCYNVLGFIHDMYHPVPGRFKDYISTPKPNMYQSLHTTVIGREGIPFEVQIRTRDMHQTAEYGIAAHWKYKSGVGKSTLESKLAWVRQLLENQEVEDEDFISSLKTDMFSDEVFVFTPNGDVVSLPAGSTPIDFAYSIHSAVGNRMIGAKVNNRMVQLDYKLQNGEIVEVLTSNSGKGPSRDWIKIVKTGEARNKIKQWFKKECREENIARGKADLERDLKRDGVEISEEKLTEILGVIANRMSFHQVDELYASIGYGGTKINRVINRIKTEISKNAPLEPNADKLVQEKIAAAPKPKTSNSGVIVPGVENCLVKFARCCTPIPGDSIIGFITRGFGVSVHRSDCHNVVSAMKEADDLSRWICVSWADDVKDKFQTSLQISAKDRSGLVMDIATVLNNLKVPVHQLDARRLGDGYAVINVVMNINGKEQLEFIMNKLNGVAGTIDVKRSLS
ncbi:MAG: bifunctional (p)ppGpp synthetase/guanosine-3',5'-bis(diphosphate) 3'-pyrophosphohydrolase [Oscillospiraceae bacterium]|nr:bifunctional (p)ppGpp synthetase/guanosine-3',5'-bis(diphosphate) 3'-pyrophosphohydrolase [Oscillospiraceae bacterium]MBQ4545038.1 bifunctional (p)ppGpp synthetase/guanosine-3',5'-bis(diphosphate) 3'-pyrophosphohydrolase [Oscillospiraceae bacterium]MBQ6902331.1 bifunctional (p)ppGpp synthetase/guanosine-3',5'-bis(diphosphate) 3'-pyrophosphohydrolase [Oscillospiraceae bacterium]